MGAMVVDWDLTRKDRGHEGDGSAAPSREASKVSVFPGAPTLPGLSLQGPISPVQGEAGVPPAMPPWHWKELCVTIWSLLLADQTRSVLTASEGLYLEPSTPSLFKERRLQR